MNSRSLKIFEKKKGIYISPENIVAISLAVLIFLIYYLKESFGFNFKGWETGILILGTIYIIGLMISTFFLHEHKNGEFKGKLKLETDKISINEKEYSIEEISEISIHSSDIEGQFIGYSFEFSRKLSNGLNNEIILKLKNGNEIKCHFFQTKRERIKYSKDYLTNYHLKGKINWLQLLNILEIEDYDKIQEFKRELNRLK